MKNNFHIISLLILTTILGSAQESMYTHFGVDEGLPSSEVYDIYQDKIGYIWFATDKGLSRYNGYEFTNYTTRDGLPGNTILKFYPQENGQVWLYEYHTKSLFYFNESFDGFHLYTYNSVLKNAIELSNAVVKSIHVDQDLNISIGGYGINGRLKIDVNGSIYKEYYSDQFHETYKGRKLYIDSKGFFTSSIHHIDGIYGIKKTLEKSFSHMDAFTLNKEQNIIRYNRHIYIQSKDTVQEIKFKNLLLGTKQIDSVHFFVGIQYGGGLIINKQGIILESYLPNKSISNFLVDHEGGYWFSTTQSGVYYMKNPKLKTVFDANISSLKKNDNNELFIGTVDGNIYKYESKELQLIYTSKSKVPVRLNFDETSNIVYALADYQLINLKTKEKENTGHIASIDFSKDKPVAIGGRHSFLLKQGDTFEKYVTPSVTQEIIWYNEHILIATSSGLYQRKNDTIIPFNHTTPLFKNRIDDIDLYKGGFVMATQGLGVVIYNDSIYNINKDTGLSSNIIIQVHVENDSTLWATTNYGINRINLHKNRGYTINKLNKKDGLISNEITAVEIARDTIWVGTKQGLNSVPLSVFDEQQHIFPNYFHLDRIVINEDPITSYKNLVLPYGDNTIDFYVQAISYKNDITYQFRIKELNEKWNTTTNRKISYQLLPSGRYTFEAKACINNNCVEELVTIPFRILPPYWNRWWFYLICISSVIGILYIFFKVRVLTYNKDVTREFIRLLIKRLKRKETFLLIRSNGEDIKVSTRRILYIKSHSNYLDIFTDKETYTYRQKIGEFVNTVPDPLEFLRVHRSYIIRIDQVTSKGKNWVIIKGKKIPVGETFLNQLEKIQF